MSEDDKIYEECSIVLNDGRVLFYSSGGIYSSSNVFIGLHGVFGIGETTTGMHEFLKEKGWKGLAPTLPGWGKSSPFPKELPLSAYVSDIAQLVKHAVGDKVKRIIVMGGSYGSIWSYSVAANNPPAGFDKLPAGTLCGLLVLGGFSPFKEDQNYSEGMTWLNWLTVGRPGLYRPLKYLHPLVGWLIQKKVAGNIDGARQLLRGILTGSSAMNASERRDIEEWCSRNNSTFEEWETSMARNMSRSVSETLEGYHSVPRLLNSDWGFKVEEIRYPTKFFQHQRQDNIHPRQ